MYKYIPEKWFWEKSTGEIYSSERQAFVSDDDSGYIEFKKSRIATPWPRNNEGEETNEALSGLLANFGLTMFAPSAEERLANAKAKKIAAIDNRTQELIGAGFQFAGSSFSMSEAAQRNWIGLASGLANGMIPFPMTVSTVDESSHVITSANDLKAFLAAYLTYQADPSQPLGSGRALKELITAATTIAEVESIVDDRQ